MTLARFLVAGGAFVEGERVALTGDEGRHAAAVRRLRVGEWVEVGDGRGNVARCTVRVVDRRSVSCDVVAVRHEPAPAPRFVVVQALAKGERGELAVELLTEVGADVVVPWAAARSVVRWDTERAERGLGRWRATAREAVKQSRRAWVPEVLQPVDGAGALALVREASLALVLHEEAEEPLARVAVPAAGDVVIVVGPEGGIAEEEVTLFVAAGARTVRLGGTVLRTSTAGAVALAVLSSRTPRWA